MTDKSKRRRFLVKHWFQIRYMLLLIGGVVVGSIVYALVLQEILHHRMNLMVASGKTVFSGEEMWISLYPMVAVCTLILFVVGILLLFLLFRIFVLRTAQASLRLENYYHDLLKADLDTTVEEYKSIPEFQALGQRTAALIRGYQRKWVAIATKAKEVRAVARDLTNESDPYRRILALRECEQRAVSLGESCSPRRSRRK